MRGLIRAAPHPQVTAVPPHRATVVRLLRVIVAAVGRALVAIAGVVAAPLGSRLSVGLRLGLIDV